MTTHQIFGPGQLFRFDMSEFQNQEALGLLLGARLGEVGYLGAVRERAAEGCLLFDEAEKAHPRVLDILLQLLDAARITVPDRNRRGREGHRADRQPGTGARKRVGHGGTRVNFQSGVRLHP